MSFENPYAPISATLEEVIEETPTIKTFVLVPDRPVAFRAGQFVQLTVPGLGEAPFTPSSSPHEKEKLEVTILRTGEVTDVLHRVEQGTTLGVRGPFGKGYPTENMEGGEVLIIGGGVGLAPLRSLLLALFEDNEKYERISIKYGAKSPEELLFRESYEDWRKIDNVDLAITIDAPAEGWDGKVGLVTTLLDDLDVDVSNSTMVSCGPGVMLKFVTFKCLDLGYTPSQIYLSMNRKMSCGIGKCGRCNIGPYYLCKDGPDMNYEKIMSYSDVF